MLDGLHIFLLSNRLGLDGFSLGGDTHHVLCHLGNLIVVALPHQRDQIPDTLLVDGFALGGKRQQPLQRADGFVHVFLVPGHLQVSAPVDDMHVQRFFDALDVFVKGAKNRDQILYPVHAQNSLNLFSHDTLQSVPFETARSFRCRHIRPSGGINRPKRPETPRKIRSVRQSSAV